MDNYKIFALGGSGGNIAENLLASNFGQDKLFYFNTDSRSVEQSSLRNKFLVGPILTQGLGSSANPNIGKQAFEESKELFYKLISDDCLYLLVGGFGGGTFTGMCSRLAEILFKQNKKFVIVGSLPYGFEGPRRQKQAIDGVKESNDFTDKIILLKNEQIRKYFGSIKLTEAFGKCDIAISEIIKEILFELDKSDITYKNINAIDPKIEEIILEVKKFIKDDGYLINSDSSKIIVVDTNKELLRAISIDPNLVYAISSRKFEELIEYIFKLSGYTTELTKATRDNGADILVWTPPPILGNKFLTIIQAKKYAQQNKVGAKEIRELIGTKLIFNADKAQIVTTSDFSLPAITTAKKNKIDLLKFYELNETIRKIIE